MTETNSLHVDMPYMGNVTTESLEKNFPVAIFPVNGFAVAFCRNIKIGQMFAAAPDMLAALQWVLEHAEYSNDTATGTDLVRAAIAKATGSAK